MEHRVFGPCSKSMQPCQPCPDPLPAKRDLCPLNYRGQSLVMPITYPIGMTGLGCCRYVDLGLESRVWCFEGLWGFRAGVWACSG